MPIDKSKSKKIVFLLAFLTLLLFLSACGGFRAVSYVDCVPETTFTSTREHVVFLVEAVPLEEGIVPFDFFKIPDDEYYLCVDDQYGKSKFSVCENLPMFAVEQMPVGTEVILDGLVVKNIPWGEEALWHDPELNFRGRVGERTVWASPVFLRGFGKGELPDKPNEDAVKQLGLES